MNRIKIVKAEMALTDLSQDLDKAQAERLKMLDVSAILLVCPTNTQNNPMFSVTLNGPTYGWSNFRFGAKGMLLYVIEVRRSLQLQGLSADAFCHSGT